MSPETVVLWSLSDRTSPARLVSWLRTLHPRGRCRTVVGVRTGRGVPPNRTPTPPVFLLPVGGGARPETPPPSGCPSGRGGLVCVGWGSVDHGERDGTAGTSVGEDDSRDLTNRGDELQHIVGAAEVGVPALDRVSAYDGGGAVDVVA